QPVTMLKPFSAGLWILIILMFVVTSLALYAIGRFSPYEDVAFVGKASTFEGLTLSNSFLYVFSTLVLQGYTAAPKSMSGRVLTGVWWVFVVFTVAAYIAGLTVILFRVNPEIRTLPFTTLDELSRQKEVGLLVVRDSTAHRYLQSSGLKLESRLLAMVTANQDMLVVPSTAEGIRKVCGMTERQREYLSLSLSVSLCLLLYLSVSVSISVSLSLSLYLSLSASLFLSLSLSLYLSLLEKKWFHEGCLKDKPQNYIFEGVPFFDTFMGDPDVIMPMTITVTRFSAAFIMFTLGLLLAGLVLAGEIWWVRRRGVAVPRKLERDDDIARIENDFHDDPDAFRT
ncbi:hypothetical protein EGW08_007845, partial [Elysia chlorotica]